MTEPTLEDLQRELRALRRTLYATLSIAGALGVAMIASCASKAAPPPTHLTFGDASHRVDIDADGLFISEGKKSVRITAGTVNATDMVIVSQDTKGASVMTPAYLRMVREKDGTAILQVQETVGVTLDLQSGAQTVELSANARDASLSVNAPDHEVVGSANATHALVHASSQQGPLVSLGASATTGCVQVERVGDDKTKPSKLCVGPGR